MGGFGFCVCFSFVFSEIVFIVVGDGEDVIGFCCVGEYYFYGVVIFGGDFGYGRVYYFVVG